MSEPIGMSIEIGGALPANLIEEFLDSIKDVLGDIEYGPLTEDELLKEVGRPIKWGGVSNYGMCDEIVAFCEKHNLSYVHHSDAKYEYDASVAYWTPGMKNPVSLKSDNDNNCLVDAATIRPLTDLLLAVAKDGKNALPLFVGVPSLEDVIEIGLKSYPKMLSALKKKINNLLPVPSALPAFTIKE